MVKASLLTQLGHVPQWGPGFCRCALHVPDAAFGLGFRYRSREGSPVPPERIERKLAAILAADVAGYSRLMGADEEGTLARLKACRRELMDPEIAEHRGRVVKTTGDGILTAFPSVLDPLPSPLHVHPALAPPHPTT